MMHPIPILVGSKLPFCWMAFQPSDWRSQVLAQPRLFEDLPEPRLSDFEALHWECSGGEIGVKICEDV